MAYTRVEELPNYPQAFADHQVALREAGDDETAKLRAQLAWTEKQRDLEKALTQHNEQERLMTDAKTQVAKDFPNVPEHVYTAAASPEAMAAAAKTFDDALQSAVASQNPANATPPPGGQPPTGLGQPTPDPNDLSTDFGNMAQKYRESWGNADTRKRIANRMTTRQVNEVVGVAMRNAKNEASRQQRS